MFVANCADDNASNHAIASVDTATALRRLPFEHQRDDIESDGADHLPSAFDQWRDASG